MNITTKTIHTNIQAYTPNRQSEKPEKMSCVHKEVSFGLLEQLSWLSLSNLTGMNLHRQDNTLTKLNNSYEQIKRY